MADGQSRNSVVAHYGNNEHKSINGSPHSSLSTISVSPSFWKTTEDSAYTPVPLSTGREPPSQIANIEYDEFDAMIDSVLLPLQDDAWCPDIC
jgi:hypothetical protein